MKVETGKTYLTRNGKHAYITHRIHGSYYSFAGCVTEGPIPKEWAREAGTFQWNAVGEFSTNQHHLDLISEVLTPLELKVGGVYKTRSGLVAYVTKPNERRADRSHLYPFEGHVEGSSARQIWTGTGAYEASGKLVHDLDLIEEVPAPLQLQAGRCYRTRDGLLASIRRRDDHLAYPFTGVVGGANNNTMRTWLADGRYELDTYPHRFDLVEEVEPRAKPERRHADLVREWLTDPDMVVESRHIKTTAWNVVGNPSWLPDFEYRRQPVFAAAPKATDDAAEAPAKAEPGKPRPHADLIKAWADGAQIEVMLSGGDWQLADHPQFLCNMKYRVKPQPPVNKVTWHRLYKNGSMGGCFVDRTVALQSKEIAQLLRIEVDGKTNLLLKAVWEDS